LSGDVDMQAVVDRLAHALRQSVLIEDRDQHPVWWSTRGAVDATRARTILDRRVDPAAAAVVRRFRLAKATAPVRTPALPEAEMWARWCMPIRSGDRLLGFLWVLDPDETIGEPELPSLVECAELAAEVMATSQQAIADARHLRDELLDRLLRSRDDEAARELARLEHVPHDACVQVAAPSRTDGWPLPCDMSAHVARSRPRVAESGAPLPLIDLGEAVRRAAATRRAIAAGARPDPPTWDHLGAWRLIVDAPAWLTVAEVHSGAAVLAAQPRSDLLTTARFFLDHGGDVAAAAAALHVHRTTLYYRLDRIIELIGVDLRGGPARTDLQLALWLEAYRRADV
jgi:hypothetical protein